MSTAVQEQVLLDTPRVRLDEIRVHTLNPRINATADDEMVDSIRQHGVLDPVMLAPAVDGQGWILIDGHRRFDGAQRAGVPDVPANPRYDLVTEAQQVEVMAITGLQKQLLSPIEEAAAYEQLTLLGMNEAAIAKATGFGIRRVKQRMKLNELSPDLRTGVHEGQISLVDIEALDEFADDPAALAELEEKIGTPNFRQQVYIERGRRERREAKAAAAAELTAAGAIECTPVPGKPGSYVKAGHLDGDPEYRVSGMHMFPEDLRDPAAHDGCLGFTVPEPEYSDVHVVCLDPGRHPKVETPAAAAPPVESDWEKQAAAREAEKVRTRAASAARLEWLVAHFAGMFPTKSHQPLAKAARAVLPLLIADGREAFDVAVLARALGIEPTTTGAAYYADLATAKEAYGAGLAAASATKVLDTFGRYLAANVAEQLDAETTWLDLDDAAEIQQHLVLWDWLKAAGYELSDVDIEIRTRLEVKFTEADDD